MAERKSCGHRKLGHWTDLEGEGNGSCGCAQAHAGLTANCMLWVLVSIELAGGTLFIYWQRTDLRIGGGIRPAVQEFVKGWLHEDKAGAAENYGSGDLPGRPAGVQGYRYGADAQDCQDSFQHKVGVAGEEDYPVT
jgi:hypothetical protein